MKGIAVYTGDFPLRQNGDGFYYFSDDLDEDKNLSNLRTYSVMALIELFLSILATGAFHSSPPYTHEELNQFIL